MNRLIFASILMLIISNFQISAQTRIVEFGNPKMKVFLPPKGTGNGKAVVACPGGGYTHMAKDHEGFYWAPYFNDLGFVYAVVEYELPYGNKEIPMNDIRKAFTILKDSAQNWKIKPDQIGIMGSSAGGHLASTMATHPSEECDPAFQILFYPVISLDKNITHLGTRIGFLGENPSDEEVNAWSSNKNVSGSTPPAFLVLCSDDEVVVPMNSILYYNALVENKVPVSMFIYPEEGHGWGYRKNFKYREEMLHELTGWLNNLK